MSLHDKYAKLLQYAQTAGVKDLKVAEQEGVLYVSGTAATAVKDQLWSIYNEIDPDMRAGDMVLNIQTTDRPEMNAETYEVKAGDSLSKIAQKYHGITWKDIYDANMDQIGNPDVIYPGQKLIIPKK